MPTIILARRAMNTRFELVLHGANDTFLRAAGEEALDEVERIEAQLSLFRPTSEIARVNRHAAEGPMRVSPPVFQLLERARALWVATGGAFDPTVGAAMEAWGFRGAHLQPAPAAQAFAGAQGRKGMDLVVLYPATREVRFACPGLQLDLGAIGKGYAVDVAVSLLREAGVTSALLHGGTSSVYGLGSGLDGRPWKIAIPAGPPAASGQEGSTAPERILAEIELVDASLGVSAAWGRSVMAEGRMCGHVLDPRSGEPADRAVLAAVVLPDATEADALSTALLVLGSEGLPSLQVFRPDLRALVMSSVQVDPNQRVARLGL